MPDYYEVYLPREDTYLMETALKKFDLSNKYVLELGVGSGYLSIYAAKQKAFVTAIDINNKAITYAKNCAKKENVKIDFIQSNLFEELDLKYKFDIIFFNPPYLVSENLDFIALDGGKKGREIIDKFLDKFDKFLSDNGFALLLHTDYNDLEETKAKLSKKGFTFEILEKQHIFFEDLYILKIMRD
jgi:release factor glutamine methyltransferase